MAETVRPASSKIVAGMAEGNKAAQVGPAITSSRNGTPETGPNVQNAELHELVSAVLKLGFPWVLDEMASMSGYGELGGEIGENQNYTFYAGIGSEMFSYYA